MRKAIQIIYYCTIFNSVKDKINLFHQYIYLLNDTIYKSLIRYNLKQIQTLIKEKT